MRATSKLLALALTAALQPAIAGTVPLNFEDISIADNKNGYVHLLDRYEKTKGIVFSDSAWGIVSSGACKGFSDFISRDGGCTGLLLNGGDSFTLNFADGFESGSSLYYSALLVGTISLFETENGTGTPFAILDLAVTPCLGGSSARFCNWNLLTFDFSGVARSMVVTGLEDNLMMDDFSFVQAGTTPPGQLPEPAGLVLAFSALGALGWARRRAAR